jgi:hypothetical protein
MENDIPHKSPIFYGGIEARFDDKIGAYTAHLNSRRWEMLGALPCIKYSEEVLRYAVDRN